MNRIDDFLRIKESLRSCLYYDDDKAIVVNDDALNVLRHFPNNSVSLILTDPPYHSTKKENIINDKSFDSDEDFISWMEQFSIEWKRILKPNGSVFMFCSSSMEAKLETMLSKRFNVLSHIVWTKPNAPGFDGWKGKMKKEALRQWYPHSERIIFFESAIDGNLKRSYFGSLLKKNRQLCGISAHELTEKIGAYGTVNHGGAVSNWESGRNIPSRKQYEKICSVLQSVNSNIEMPQYEDVIRPFEVNSHVEFTDVWNFPSVRPYKGKHPAEKPLELLEHCILSTTFEGDIILDCFAGSGSTLVASVLTKRYSVGIEIDKRWCKSIGNRLDSIDSITISKDYNNQGEQIMKKSMVKNIMPSLFDDIADTV